MTYKELQDRVMAFGYGESDRDWIKVWLNMSYADVATRRRWTWLERSVSLSTTAGQQAVSVPTPAGALITYWGRLKPAAVESPALDYVSEMGEDPDSPPRRFMGAGQSGPPQQYSLWNGQVLFYPVPDRTYSYTLRYWTLPGEMSADADTPVVPAGHHNLLVLGALMYASDRDHNPGLYGQRQAAYEAAIARLVAVDRLNQAESPTKVPMPEHYGGRYG